MNDDLGNAHAREIALAEQSMQRYQHNEAKLNHAGDIQLTAFQSQGAATFAQLEFLEKMSPSMRRIANLRISSQVRPQSHTPAAQRRLHAGRCVGAVPQATTDHRLPCPLCAAATLRLQPSVQPGYIPVSGWPGRAERARETHLDLQERRRPSQ